MRQYLARQLVQLVIVVVLSLFFLLQGGLPPGGIIAPLATLLLVGGLGAFDDYLNAKTGEGISARQKMAWLVIFAGATLWCGARSRELSSRT